MKHTTVKAAKENAEKKYDEKLAAIESLLKDIKNNVERIAKDDKKKGNIHWGHVGSIAYVESQLQEVADLLNRQRG